MNPNIISGALSALAVFGLLIFSSIKIRDWNKNIKYQKCTVVESHIYKTASKAADFSLYALYEFDDIQGIILVEDDHGHGK